jgi:L-seryl-tRNA(Ser) seleniumtransferase
VPQKSVPPSVHEIAKLIGRQTGDQNPSPAVTMREARKLQKRWNKLMAAGDFTKGLTKDLTKSLNSLPGPRRPVINATGILLHTNLGRAPLGRATLERLTQVLAGYSNLEVHLHSGERGGRTAYLDALFETLAGAYKPIWVNNNAAAVLLSLNTLKKQTGLSKMIISRGELVEIGGGFRVPEIMSEAGFELIEVGTTNKTRLNDYVNALKKTKGVICSVHPSNFVMRGFAESVKPEELISVAKKFKVPLIYDAGTMTGDEMRRLQTGFDCVTVSTDKTLGSVQGGLIMAKPKLQIEILKNPLYRAFRLDKLSLTALEVAFEAHAEKTDRKTLPFSQMFYTTKDELGRRAEALQNSTRAVLKNFDLKLVDCTASVGGGALPGEELPSIGIAVVPRHKTAGTPQKIVNVLRKGSPAVLASVVNSYATLNLLTILDWQLPEVAQALGRLDEKCGTMATMAHHKEQDSEVKA